MGAIVPRAVDALDPDELLDRLDLDAVLGRIDLDSVLARIDLNELLARLDVDALMNRVDVDALIGRVDVNRLVTQVDVNGLVQQVDIDGLMNRVDVDALIGRVDVNHLVTQVDVNALVAQVDVNSMIGQVDVNSLVAQVDVDSMIGQVDVQKMVERVDLNDLMGRVDVAALTARAGIDQIVADATSGMASRTLDLARRQIIRIDLILMTVVARVLGRRSGARANEPDHGRTDDVVNPASAASRALWRPGALTAGPLARTVAFLIDSLAVSSSFSLGVAMGGFLLGLFTTRTIDQIDTRGTWWLAAFLGWWFVYLWLSVAAGGRTIGKGVVGLRVSGFDGDELSPGRSAVRTLALPFSLVFGLGLIPAVLGRRRQALHDLAAGSRVGVDWGPRPVSLPQPWARWTEVEPQPA